MQRRMNRLFDPWGEDDFEEPADYRRAWADFRETESEFLIAVELPGIEKEDISLEVVNGALAIRAERKQEKEQKNEKKGQFVYSRSYSGFARTIPLPENSDADKIEAEFKNGVLKVHVPRIKTEKKKGKEIKIR
jgi:HSP20 family protein